MDSNTHVEQDEVQGQIYAVCLESGSDGFPEVNIFRPSYDPLADQVSNGAALNNASAVYFRIEDESCITITQQVAQTYWLGAKNNVRLSWMIERQHASVPQVMLHEIARLFRENQLTNWNNLPGFYGIVDKNVLIEGISTADYHFSTIDSHELFLTDQAISGIDYGETSPRLLVIQATALRVCQKTIWRTEKINRKAYIDQFIRKTISKLGAVTDGRRVVLLSQKKSSKILQEMRINLPTIS